MSRQKPLKLIRASAGSGKTFTLTAHYLVLLFSGKGKYREILAVTFTNKATAEMKSRILDALRELADTGYERSKFSQILTETYPDLSDQEIRVRASEIYSNILHDYSRFSVSTIDGFVQQLIRSFAFELNLDSGYKLEMNQEKVKEELIRALNLKLEHDSDLMEWVTNLAIERIADGKDWDYQRTLKDLADEIFKERYYPFQEAMLAMGDDQGREFNSLRELVNNGINEFREFMTRTASSLKRSLDESGVLPDELNQKSRNPLLKLDKIINEDFSGISSLASMADNFDQWPNKSVKDDSAVRRLYELINPEIKSLTEYVNEHGERYETYLAISKNSSYLRLMQGMADLLKNYRSENRSLLISDAQQLLKGITAADVENPSFIWEKTGNRYKHFLFDEFQDTSTFQWINFLPLVKNAISTSEMQLPEHLVVGDVKQSIYRWRNGDWRILHSKVRDDLSADNIIEDNLGFNRRSSANIIRFNNYLYAKLPAILQQLLNNVFAETARPHLQELWQTENEQLIESAYRESEQKTTGSTNTGGKVEIRFFEKESEEEDPDDQSPALLYTVSRLTELLEKGFSMRDIGILVRTNSEAGQVLDVILAADNQDKLSRAAGKPFQVISGEALRIAGNPAVQLLITTYRLLAANEIENHIFKAECGRLYRQIRNSSSLTVELSGSEWLELAVKPIGDLGHILPLRLCQEFLSFRRMPVTELADKLISIYGFSEQDYSKYIPYLLAFRDQVAVFASGGDQGIGAFIDWWDTEGYLKALPSSADQDAVQVMTVHKSKGLEFGAVIIPFVNWKLNISSGFIRKLLWVDAASAGFGQFSTLPVDYNKGLSSTAFASNYFEEMLLNYMDVINTLYVATTRAKYYLCMICPQLPPRPKTGSVNDIQLVLSDMLATLSDADPPFTGIDGNFVFGDFPDTGTGRTESTDDSLVIDQYLVNEEVASKFRKNTSPDDLWFNARQRKGVVMHRLLEKISDLGNLDKLVAELVQDGLIRKSEQKEVVEAVREVLTQPEIRRWYQDAKQVISERDMILAGGIVKRPDKLFVFDDSAVLLDFKFGAEQARYLDDIRLYRDTLLGMGEFGAVEAYLWYSQESRLVKV